MIRGTTPKLEFTLPFEVSKISEAYITISQRKCPVIEKKLDECEAHDNVLSVRLSQEETLALVAKWDTEIQIRVRTDSGDALASTIIRVETERILKDGVI